jgi:hypothetical protein
VLTPVTSAHFQCGLPFASVYFVELDQQLVLVARAGGASASTCPSPGDGVQHSVEVLPVVMEAFGEQRRDELSGQRGDGWRGA